MSVSAILIAAAVAGGTSTIMQGYAAAAQGKVQKKIADYNAKQLERQARAQRQVAGLRADQLGRQSRFVQAANRAIASKSGLSISESPSTVEVLADTAYQFHLEQNYILNQGMQDYVATLNQASLLRAEGAYALAQGRQARTMALISGGAQMGLGLWPYAKPLAGNQAAIKSAGGLGTISGSPQIKNFMSPTL